MLPILRESHQLHLFSACLAHLCNCFPYCSCLNLFKAGIQYTQTSSYDQSLLTIDLIYIPEQVCFCPCSLVSYAAIFYLAPPFAGYWCTASTDVWIQHDWLSDLRVEGP